jgi:hypothetical protein
MNKVIQEIDDRLNGEGYATLEDLKKARRRLWRLDNDTLDTDEWVKKLRLLQCLQELVAEEKDDSQR